MIMRPPRRVKYFLPIIIFIFFISAALIGWIVISKSTMPLNIKPKTRITNPKSVNNSVVLMAGNISVPVSFQARAKKLGYYCLSWDAKPGIITPDTCIPLNK